MTSFQSFSVSTIYVYDHILKQKNLDDQKAEAKSLLKMKVNKKLLQQHLTVTSNKIVTLQDISNIQSEANANDDGNNLTALVNRLREIEGKVWLMNLVIMVYL